MDHRASDGGNIIFFIEDHPAMYGADAVEYLMSLGFNRSEANDYLSLLPWIAK